MSERLPSIFVCVRYVNCKDMAREACDAVRDGQLDIIPNQFEDTWFRFSSTSPTSTFMEPQLENHVKI